MKLLNWVVVSFSLMILNCSPNKNNDLTINAEEVNQLAIQITPDTSRQFVYTNKEAAFFYGESGRILRNGHQGFYVMEKKYLDDYIIGSENGRFHRYEAQDIKMYPDHLERSCQDGVVEKLYLLDHLNCLAIDLLAQKPHHYFFIPLFPDGFDVSDYRMEWNNKKNLLILCPAKNDSAQKDSRYIGVKFSRKTKFDPDYRLPVNSFISVHSEQIGKFEVKSKTCKIFFIVGKNERDVEQLSHNIQKNFDKLVNQKQRRLQKLLNACYFSSDQPEFDLSFKWALISMDQLIMKQPGAYEQVTGIFAGLPWFNNYWGRDTFISFAGAVLTTGKFEEAKSIIKSFAKFQNKNPGSLDFGRIPNRITVGEIIYNTADGTPWFIRELREYYKYTGDKSLLKELYPVIKLSIEGTLRYHCDNNYFLTHGDAETWMDAQGGEGPWSPRGNRAVEIQALWYQQLMAASEISRLLGEDDNAEKWNKIAVTLKKNFRKAFWNHHSQSLYDHLNVVGTPDTKIRPNQIFALTVVEEPLLSADQELAVLKQVTTKLTYPYGVASLWQHDPDFHPYHQYPSHYPKDAAYHNGTVWCWLAGPVISSLVKYGYFDLAYELLASESFQILHLDAAGSMSELLDALPRKGENIPHVSGTVSQAWSLAEYIRNIYQDILGIYISAPENKIILNPHIPTKMNRISFKIPLPGNEIKVDLSKIDSCRIDVDVHYISGDKSWDFEINYPVTKTKCVNFGFSMKPGELQYFTIFPDSQQIVSQNGLPVKYHLQTLALREADLPDLSFVKPELDPHLKCLQPPSYPLLPGSQIVAWDPDAKMIFDVKDPEFDDRGIQGKYSYPTDSHFKDGIFDLKRFQLWMDQKNYYFRLQFRNLVQPGWHPEYGFQLTYVAIAIDQNGTGKGAKFIPKNANYNLPHDLSYDRIIFIGGGIQVEDNEGRILAAYRPTENGYPIGNVEKKEIRFAIPVSFVGEYSDRWQFVVLVGGQDDHGGAGLGEFRNVGRIASQWSGGGGDMDQGNCSVYDVLFIKNNRLKKISSAKNDKR